MTKQDMLDYVKKASESKILKIGKLIDMAEEHYELLERLQPLLDDHESAFKNVANKIETKIETQSLPKPLQEKLKALGNTPIEEPEISKKLQDDPNLVLQAFETIMTVKEMDAYSIEEIAGFAGAATRQITSFKTNDGVFKTTPNLSSWKPPRPSDIAKNEESNKRWIKAFELSQDSPEDEKLEKKWESLYKKHQDFIFGTTGLNKKTLTEWEINLSIEMARDDIAGFRSSFMGKR